MMASAAGLRRLDSLARRVDADGTLLGTRLGTERVQAFSDAVLSIVATVLVVPLLKVGESSKKEIFLTGGSLWKVLTSPYRLEMFAMCWIAFWFVFLVFVWHGRKFRGLDRANTALVSANWLELLAASLLPFTTATAANSSSASGEEEEVIEQYLHLNLLLIALAHLLFQGLAFLTQRSALRALQLQEALCIAVVCLIAVSVSFLDGSAVWAVYVLIPAVTFVYYQWSQAEEVQAEALEDEERVELERRASLGMSPGVRAAEDPPVGGNSSGLGLSPSGSSSESLQEPLVPVAAAGTESGPGRQVGSPGGVLSVAESVSAAHAHRFHHRIEAFVDGVVAISATLIVLEIQPIAACHEMSDDDCLVHFSDGCRLDLLQNKCVFDDREAWERKQWMMLAYVATFFVCNLLWTLHHLCMDTIVSLAHCADRWTIFFTGHFCLFVSLIPTAFSLFTDYAVEPVSKSKIDPLHPGKRLNPDELAASTATTLACAVIYLASMSLLGVVAHHHLRYGVPLSRRDAVRFTLLPVVMAVCAVVAAQDECRLLLVPMFAFPPALFVLYWVSERLGCPPDRLFA